LGNIFAARKRQISERDAVFLIVTFYTILVNVPFWVAGPLLSLRGSGYFCVEYCAIGVIALFLPGTVSGIALVALALVDISVAVSETFAIPISQCAENLSIFNALSLFRLVATGLVLLMILAIGLAAAFLPLGRIRGRHRTYAASCLVLFALTSVLIDYGTLVKRAGHFENPTRHGFHEAGDAIGSSYFEEFHPSRMPLVRLVRSEFNYAQVCAKAHDTRGTTSTVASAASLADRRIQVVAQGNRDDLPDLVLVLVESWGLHEDKEVNESLLDPYRKLADSGRYRLLQGTVPYFGFTVVGEGRELCASRIGFYLAEALPSQLKGCLTERLNALGYQSIAMHGMDGQLFNRATWYKAMGFQETQFKSEFERQGLPNCPGAFIGTCDSDVAHSIDQRLAEEMSKPRFIYWVTLNSHLPVLVPSPLHHEQLCLALSALRDQAAVCSWYQLIWNVHHSISEIAAGNHHRPTIFVVVGDHAPPFSTPMARSQFSSTVVPYLVLLPNERAHEVGKAGDRPEQRSE
jgi:hypothetical protein